MNDSLAPTDAEAERSYPLDAFWKAYQGLALVITGRQKGRGEGCPHRRHARLRALEQVGAYMFQDENGADLPCRRILPARWPAPWRTAPSTPPPPTRPSAF